MLAELVVWYLVFVFSTTFHEFSHALVGRIGGDRTAQHAGLVTMDPTVHILRSPFGMLVMPVLSFVLYQWMIGWASVPYDPVWGRRHPWRSALMSAAGPIANFVLAALGIVVLRVLLSRGVLVTPEIGTMTISRLADAPGGLATPLGSLSMALSVLVTLNVLLGCFNLLPIPPLDGSGIAEGIGPKAIGRLFDYVREQPMLMMSGTILAWVVINPVVGWAFIVALRLIYPR